MFSHVVVGTNDLEKAKRFYDAVLGALGASLNVRRLACEQQSQDEINEGLCSA